jgi:hypothetical protein
LAENETISQLIKAQEKEGYWELSTELLSLLGLSKVISFHSLSPSSISPLSSIPSFSSILSFSTIPLLFSIFLLTQSQFHLTPEYVTLHQIEDEVLVASGCKSLGEIVFVNARLMVATALAISFLRTNIAKSSSGDDYLQTRITSALVKAEEWLLKMEEVHPMLPYLQRKKKQFFFLKTITKSQQKNDNMIILFYPIHKK